tara:strand:+ start:493 stop:2220 length:1728 start_codon:yes stop_codon:yes gene_type:complete
MAVNLNPGADATLVQAATNAAMANVPKDLSQMFQAQTENYRKTMESVGKSYGSAIETVGKVAGEAVKEAIHINEQLIRAGNTESEDTKEFFTNELLALKEEKKALRGMQVFSKERIAARLKMEKRRTDLFAMVDLHESKIDNNIDMVAMENFNPSVTGLNNLTIARSINMKGRPIEEGKQKGIYSRILRRDDGKVGWQTYDSDDRAISSINKDGSIVYAEGDNKASFIQDKDLSGLLKQKDDKAQAAVQAIDLRAAKNGANGHNMGDSKISITREYSDVITEKNIGQLLDRGVGDNISFNEALNTEFTSLSMEAYAGIEKVAGIHDTDGVEGITKADFDVTDKNAVNYALNLENHETLRNAMDPNSKTFNYEATKKALASHNASLSIAKNQTSLEEYNAKQVNANTLATTKQRGATLTNQIRQEQLNKLQNPADTPVDYFPSASKTGGGGVIFRGTSENYNPTKSGLISIREDIQSGQAFNLGNIASVTPDGKGGWDVQKFETLTKDMPNPNDKLEIWPKGKIIKSGGVVNYKNTDKLILNALPRDFRQFPPEQYLTAEQKRALKLIEEAKNVNK